MKTAKRILTVALALMLIFAMAAPSFALQTSGYVPTLNGMPYYIQNTNTNVYKVSGTFTVYLSIYSGIYDSYGPINNVLSVTMGSTSATNQLYTVRDVLVAAHSQYPAYSFDIQYNVNTLMGHYDSWLQGVSKTSVGSGISFEALPLHYNGNTTAYPGGWMFRVNGMIPFFYPTGSSDPIGCLITDAYVTADDVVDLYYDNMYTQSLATVVYAARYTGKSSGKAVFQLLGTESYVNSSGENWTVTNWAKVITEENTTIAVKIDSTTYNVSTNSQGIFTISGLSSGTHSVQVLSASRPSTQAATYTDENNVIHYYRVPKYVGMYSRFTF